MLSTDELNNGFNFILKLTDSKDTPVQWVANLHGDVATRWYRIYQASNWDALRAGGAQVFHDLVTGAEAERVRKSARCVVIHTSAVKAEEIGLPPRAAMPIQPQWEEEGGTIASLKRDSPVPPMLETSGNPVPARMLR